SFFFFFQAEDGIRDFHVTGVQTCALPILSDVSTFRKTSDSTIDITVQLETIPFDRISAAIAVERLRKVVQWIAIPIDLCNQWMRSEERRVGKECRCRWAACCRKKKNRSDT